MHRDSGESACAWAIALIALVIGANCHAQVQAQEQLEPEPASMLPPDIDEVYPAPRPTVAQRRLIELVAKVSFNEAGASYHDLALIWQIVEGHGESSRERIAWLERHSPCVSGRLSQDEAYRRPGNCRWTRNLMPDGRRPRGWNRQRNGRWEWVREHWLRHVRRVRRFVLGSNRYRPCAETPHSWDGVRYGARRVGTGSRRILECEPPYTAYPAEPGLHNFAVRWDANRDAS